MPQLDFEFGSTRSPDDRRLERRLLHPIDYLRRRLTRGRLQVGAREKEVRRGGELEAWVTIASPGGLGEVEVGLVCTEFYECKRGHVKLDEGVGESRRGTSSATVHEAWLPVEGSPGVHDVRLTVAPDAPFTYEGELLCFKWEVVARGRRKHRLDAQARHEISVLP